MGEAVSGEVGGYKDQEFAFANVEFVMSFGYPEESLQYEWVWVL